MHLTLDPVQIRPDDGEGVGRILWFRNPPYGSSLSTITMAPEPSATDTGPPGAINITSMSLWPQPPTGTMRLTLGDAQPSGVAVLTVAVLDHHLILDPGFEVLLLEYLRPDLSIGSAADFDFLPGPTDAPQVTRYLASQPNKPRYTLDITYSEKLPDNGPTLPDQVLRLRFGNQPDYTPNRDALVAAVNLRR